jgi:hypothetical protein
MDSTLRRILIITGIVCYVIGIVLCIALPVASVKTVETSEIALDYDNNDVSIDYNELYTNGRHFIGVIFTIFFSNNINIFIK